MNFRFRQMASHDRPKQLHEALDVSRVVKGRKDIHGISPLTCDLTAVYVEGNAVEVTGKLFAELDMSCSRCLKPLKRKVDIDFEETFKRIDTPEEEGQNEEEDDIWLIADDQVDLNPYIEEALLLNLPYAAVCKEDCKGLCPSCGTDLNERDCDCEKERIDPRLAALGDFFKK